MCSRVECSEPCFTATFLWDISAILRVCSVMFGIVDWYGMDVVLGKPMQMLHGTGAHSLCKKGIGLFLLGHCASI